jgi:hypothetical protein
LLSAGFCTTVAPTHGWAPTARTQRQFRRISATGGRPIMGQMITKPDANPIVFAACNLCVGGGLGYFMMGQKRKAMMAFGFNAVSFILTICSFGLAGVLFFANWVFAYDAYLLSQKLQSGQAIGENENGLEFLNAVFKD